MDWAGIEEIVYSEAADSHKLLGPHITDDGLLIPHSYRRQSW